MIAWAAYGGALALYAVGHAMHRAFAPRKPGWRPGKQRAFAVGRRRWSLRRKRLSLMRMRLEGVWVVRMPQRDVRPDEPVRPVSASARERPPLGGLSTEGKEAT